MVIGVAGAFYRGKWDDVTCQMYRLVYGPPIFVGMIGGFL